MNFQNELNTTLPYEAFYAGGGQYERIPPEFKQGRFQKESLYGSAYFIKDIGTHVNNNNFKDLLNKTSNIDNALKLIFNATDEYFGAYMGFEDNGLWWSFPYFHLRNHQNKRYLCEPNKISVVGYDPRCRGWYVVAKQEPQDIYTLTSPYNDATTNALMITISHKVFDSNGFIGVVGMITDLSQASKRIANNLGGTDITQGANTTDFNDGNAGHEFHSFKQMFISAIETARVQQAQTNTMVNPMYIGPSEQGSWAEVYPAEIQNAHYTIIQPPPPYTPLGVAPPSQPPLHSLYPPYSQHPQPLGIVPSNTYATNENSSAVHPSSIV